MSNPIIYPGKDLESMSFAVNYHKWVLDEFRPYLGKRVVEVGAGTGSFSSMILGEAPEKLSLVEPSEMFAELVETVKDKQGDTTVELHHGIFEDVVGDIVSVGEIDSIFYVNVLEHIENDVAELSIIYNSLIKGGRCFIFVPALMLLYSEFDRSIGHFRRYSKTEIEEKLKQTGFLVKKSKYFDVLGILPWYVKYRLFRSISLNSGAVSAYDHVGVPITRFIEQIIPPFIGKSILIIGEK